MTAWQRAEYRQAAFRAAYYRWSAFRGDPIPGGDPVTGRPRARYQDTGEGRAAYVAMARHWLRRAAALRCGSAAP